MELSFDDLIPPRAGAPNVGGEVSFDDLIPRGDGILEGVTDPQQYAEFAKGIVPGAAGMVLGTVPKGAAVLDPVEAIQANMQRYVEQMRRVPQMTPDELAAFRMEVEKEPAPATRIAVQSAISDLLDGSARMEDVEARFAPPTPMAKRPLYRAGVAGEQFAKDIIPAAPGYEQAVGRQLGEGLGTMVAGLPVAMVGGGIPAGIFFGVSGAGEAVDRAVKFDEAEKKAGRPGLTEEQILLSGLMGIGPGSTDILPIEVLLGNLKIPTPFRKPLAQAIGRIGGQAAIEGFQEGGQAFLQNLIEREIYNDKRGLAEGVHGDAGVGAGVGAIAQGGKELLGLLLPGRRRGAGQPAGEAKQPAAEPEVLPPESPPADAPIAAPEAPPPGPQAAPMPEDAALALQELDAMLAQQAAEPEGIAQSDTVAPEVRARARQILQDDIEGLTAADADAAIEQATAPEQVPEPIIPAPSNEAEEINKTPAPVPADTALPGEDLAPAPSEEAAAVEEAAAQTAEPTEGQKAAGNYRKGSVNFQGLDIKIETPRGAERTGIDKDGKPWATIMPAHYGYFKKSEAKDGDQIDVYLGPQVDSTRVFVIDQIDPKTRKYDEAKVILGTSSPTEALAIYQGGFSDGSGAARVGSLNEMSIPDLKAWLGSDRTKRPFFDGSKRRQAAQPKPKAPGGVSGVEGNAVALQQSEDGDVQELRREGDHGLPRVVPFPNLPARRGAKAEPAAQFGKARQQPRLRAGERPLGSQRSARLQQEIESTDPLRQREDTTLNGGASVRTEPEHSQTAGRAQRDVARSGAEKRQSAPQVGDSVRREASGSRGGAPLGSSEGDAKVTASARSERAGGSDTTTTGKAKLSAEGAERAVSDGSVDEKDQGSLFSLAGAGPRRIGIPPDASKPISSYKSDADLKAHPDYKAAKAGEDAAAVRLVADLVKPESIAAAARFGQDVLYLPVVAEEQTGDNAIPRMLAEYYAGLAGAGVAHDIGQANQAFHTGATAMERIANRALFSGSIEAGRRYVLVDDVSVMGSTLADLADHIQRGGGEVAGVVVLANASRTGVLTPPKLVVRAIERRFGDEITNLFGIEPSGLTADEAAYLLNFKDADAIRVRIDASARQRAERLRQKGVRGPESEEGEVKFSLTTPRAQEKRDLLEQRLTAMVRHIAGENVQVAFPNQIPLWKEMAQGWGSYKDKFRTAAGSYIPADRLIKIALADPKYGYQTSTAVHEAFHAVEHLLLTDKEMAVLKAAEPQLRKVAQDHAELTDKQAQELADYEVRAIAFQAYAEARMNGKPIAGLSGAVRRILEKLRQMFQRIRNALTGMGFRNANDVFSDVYEGKMAGREAKERPIGEAAPASLSDGKPDAASLARFVRGEITAEQFAPGAEKWKRLDAYIGKTFKEPQRAKLASAIAGDVEMDTLTPTEKAVATRLLDQVGGKPPAPPKPPATTGGKGDGNAQRRILDRIVPSDKAKKKLPTLNQVYTAAKDDLNPLRVIRNELTEGTDIPIERDPYRLARLVRGAVGKAQQMIQNGTFAFKDLHDTGKSLTQILAPVEKDLDGFRAYMAARRAVELAGRGIKTGIDVDDARSVVRDGLEKFAKPFEELVAYQRRVLDYLRDSGIVGPEAYAAMVEANKDYVPFFRYMEGDAEGMGTSGRNLRVKDPVKGIKGSTREIIDPIESIIKNTFLYVALAEKNRALTALDDLAASSPKGEKFLRKPDDKVVKPAEGEGEADAMSAFKPDGFSPAKDRIAFYRNGKREVREVDPELAAAVNAMDRETFGWLLKILATPARLLRAGATLAPEFIVRNPVRDQFTAFIFSDNGFVPVWDTLRGVGGIFRRDADFQAWLKAGGANATLVSLDRKYIDEQVFRLSDPSFLKRFNNVVTSPVTFLRMLSEVMENATRVGEFKRARGKGKSDFDAAFGSREVTLDFARKGAQMKAVNSLVAFFNASLEGTDREIRGFAKRPLASSIKVMAAITLPSILLWFANHDDDRYKELPQWEKDIFWHVLTKDTIWRIPKPFALGVLFGSVPERALEAFVAKRPKAFKELGESFVQSFVPGLIPEFMKPTIEQFANRSTFTGRNIVPKYLENVLPQDQATHFTSDTAKLIGKAMSKLGLDQSSFSSPLVIDNYIRAWTGGLGTHVVKLADKSLRASGVTPSPVEPTSTLADMPVIKAFVSRYPSASAKSIQDFYDIYEERRRAVGSVKLHARAGDTKKSEEIRREYAIENAERIHRALGQQHKFIRDIHANKAMAPDEKRRIIDATYMQMIEFSKAGNAMFLSTEEKRKAANQ